jgi:hypothetical protein
MVNEFERDETKSQDFRGDGCYNCMNNPKHKEALEKTGKVPVNYGIFTEAMEEFSIAYNYEIETEMKNVYWKHLRELFKDDEEFEVVMYTCIDTYVELPTIAEIIETMTHVRMKSF